jgi:phytoene synthase
VSRPRNVRTHSEVVTRRSGTSFYHAFRLLPARKRRAIYALYAFCRTVDDCVDEEDGEGEAGLDRWNEEVDRCYAGRPTTPLGEDLARAVSAYPIPRNALGEIVDGCRMDLTTARYSTWSDLEVYCRRVASAVGLCVIEVFGYRDPGTRDFAVHLGLALQLTNILRDVAVDARRDRLYLPLEDLARFELDEAEVLRCATSGTSSRRMAELLAFEGERAQGEYVAADRALPSVDRRAMWSARVMGGIYRSLLGELARRRFPVGEPRVRLSGLRKASVAVRTVVVSGLGL